MGYIKSKIQDSFEEYVKSHGGQIKGEYVSSMTKTEILCKNGHVFDLYPIDFKKNKWCKKCEYMEILSYILKEELDVPYKTNFSSKNLTFDFVVEIPDKTIYIDIDDIMDYNEKNRLDIFKDKIIFVGDNQLIKLTYEDFEDREEMVIFLAESMREDIKLCIKNEMMNEVIKKLKFSLETQKENKIEKGAQVSKKSDDIVIDKNVSKVSPIKDNKLPRYFFGYCVDDKITQNNITIENQISEIKEYISKSNNYILKKVFEEYQMTNTIKNRKQLNKLFDILRDDDFVIVYSLDVISTKEEEKDWFIKELEVRNIHLVKLKESKVFTKVEEKEDLSYKMNKKSSSGLMRTRPPYGMKFVKRNKPFEEIPEEQAIIQRIRELRKELQLPTLTMICRTLDKEGLFYRKGKKWHTQRLSIIMRQNNIQKCPSFNYNK